jgi:hypothetical protein
MAENPSHLEELFFTLLVFFDKMFGLTPNNKKSF